MQSNQRTRKSEPHCAYCGALASQVELLTPAGGPRICPACIEAHLELLTVMRQRRAGERVQQRPDPVQIKAYLDRHVVGQDDAKVALAVAAHNHLKRVEAGGEGLVKSNVLLMGPTGSGKTLLVQQLAEYLGLPFAVADATGLTESGYQGEDVTAVIGRLVAMAGGNTAEAERGIVLIDEVDKLARVPGHPGRDISGEGVQQSLLKLLEGTDVEVRTGKFRTALVHTRHILFVCSGAFHGLAGNLFSAPAPARRAGFIPAEPAPIPQPGARQSVTMADLVAFGMLPELIGRLHLVVATQPLAEDDLVRILTEPEDALTQQYTRLLAMDGVELVFEPQALQAVAREAVQRGTGARGLRSIMERVLMPVMFLSSQYRGQRILVSAGDVGDRIQSEAS